jgi:predicted RNase H-like HicB family nuclease
MIYGIVFEDAPDGNVGAYLPDMPGVVAVGPDRQTAMEMLDDAVRWHVDGMIEDGTPIPDPSSPDQLFDAWVILDRTYVEHVSEHLRQYFISSSNSAAAAILKAGFLGSTAPRKIAAVA